HLRQHHRGDQGQQAGRPAPRHQGQPGRLGRSVHHQSHTEAAGHRPLRRVPLRQRVVPAVAIAAAVLFSGLLPCLPVRPVAAAKPEKPYTVYAGAYTKPPKKGEAPPPKVKTIKSFMKGLTV